MKTAKAHTITYVVIIPILGQKRNTLNPKKRVFAKKCVYFLSKGIKIRLKQKANETAVRQTDVFICFYFSHIRSKKHCKAESQIALKDTNFSTVYNAINK